MPGVTLGKHRSKSPPRTAPAHEPAAPPRVPTSPRERLAALASPHPIDASDLAPVRSPRLELRPLCESDRAAYLDAVRVSRGALDRWAPLHRPSETDDELFDRQLALTHAAAKRADGFRRVAWYHDRIAGGFNLTSITRGLSFEADTNWWVRSDLTRLGLGTEGLSALMEIALAPLPVGLGLQRVLAVIRPDNHWSVRLAERSGFRRIEGDRRSVMVGGSWETHDVYERTA